MSDRRPIAKDTRERQRAASDPAQSAWVAAHAGSGKTHVLSQRVVRLLLAGAPPSRILCLTYTKAAAANMAARIFDILAGWALLDDEALTAAILATGAPQPSRTELVFARRLFARTVETPGGLKIQTIHAFCERILHLFPFEANVAASFRVLDDLERAELLERARRQTLARAVLDEGELRAALETVSRLCSGGGFDELIAELLGHRAAHRNLSSGDYAELLRERLGLREGETLENVEREIVEGGIGPRDWNGIAQALRGGGANDGKLATQLMIAAGLAGPLPGPPPLCGRGGASDRLSACVEEFLAVFFKKDGEPRGLGKQKIISAALQKQQPALLARLEEERDRLVPLAEKRKAAAALDRSMALARIGDAILSAYERMKSNRGLFDFDDLIERTRRLFRSSSPSWVLYKLDSRIDHILVDEAQDTSAAQWDILAALADEFCAGAGATRRIRTFFAVGDEKQSIFSFQGAAPEKFDAMRRDFARRFRDAELGFETVRLTRSFRSSPQVLGAVDIVFSVEENRRGLAADRDEPAPLHEAWKTDVPGLVEIWEPEASAGAEAPQDWRLPLDYVNEAGPPARLARKIARKVKALLAPQNGESVEDKGVMRAVRPGDVMILVRKRDAFFEGVIRALKAEGIPVAGADRLDLSGHIAVMDLVALGRVALLREDDLTLATLLKSPLLGFTDDDLIALAPKREGALIAALVASPQAPHREAATLIEHWSEEARSRAPFDFYSHILSAGGGREKLVGRLGQEANDAIDEFLRLALSFEREQAQGLVGFLAGVESLQLSVKRDMEAAGDAVRVMTVHASKGLEAKIVFLPDTCGGPSGRHDPKIFRLGEEDGATLVWSTTMAADPPAVASAREALREAAREEHRRLLYVALTRAEERLYVGGFHGPAGRGAGCWHDAIRNALEPACERAPDPLDETKEILRYGAPARGATTAGEVGGTAAVVVPAYASEPAPAERAPTPPLRPATALAAADPFAAEEEPAAPTRRDRERLLVGRLTHALLQRLPDTPPERRVEAALRFLELRGAPLDAAERQRLVSAVLGVIGHASLAPLFGPGSAPEVEIVARLEGPRGEIAICGRIDRLAETETDVIVADFKTGAPRHPATPAQLRQLAVYRAAALRLYPDKRVRCALIFTQSATIEEPEPEALDAALEEILREV
ncbi:double-strand break repair helicase AddA [Methylosinus sp. H3A]|uniref:double-strand break repair helicase AddA n=1 Tax=Methylosinus sp. H3A TaxID=2785786 RepID=UPI0018C31B89|nr:double-strand break repair helicase AddA [Methylosinus sp. H3A]MBG0810214.1 double-strand break repair helicase AddA [Methylosinus sp. H3A]